MVCVTNPVWKIKRLVTFESVKVESSENGIARYTCRVRWISGETIGRVLVSYLRLAARGVLFCTFVWVEKGENHIFELSNIGTFVSLNVNIISPESSPPTHSLICS